MNWLALALACLFIAVAAGAYFIGRDSVDTNAYYSTGYKDGQANPTKVHYPYCVRHPSGLGC